MDSARLALAQATQAWGGAGFVLVPHRDGKVPADLTQAVVAYDPDYLAVSARTLGQQEAAAPGSLTIYGAEGLPLDGEARDEAIARSADQIVHDEASRSACEALLESCTTHRHNLAEPEQPPEWDDAIATLTMAAPDGVGLTAVSAIPGYNTRPCRSAAPGWGGALGLLATARVGAEEPPQFGATSQPTGSEAAKLASWLQGLSQFAPPRAIELAHNPAGADLSFNVDQLPVAWDNSTLGLVPVSHRSTRLTPAFVVLGDTAEDFALWLILDRLYARAVWLHSDWFDLEADDASSLDRVVHEWQRFKRGVRVCSVSRQDFTPRLREALVERPVAFGASRERQAQRIVAADPDWAPNGQLTLAAHDDFSVEIPVPVHRDDDGGVTLLTKPPAMALFDDAPPASAISWQVDLTFDGSTMPRKRGLLGSALCAPDQDPFHTWVRSSRAGVTWHSARYDLVLEGGPPDQRVARPKVRELGMQDWTATMAALRGYRIRVSAAGQRARVLTTLWGSREAMIADYASPWRDVFRLFGPAGAPGNQGSSARFEEGHGAVISGHGAVMTFAGIQAAWSDQSDPAELRQTVDGLLARRVLRRGLALLCGECGKAAFYPVEDLGQQNVCARCSAVTSLSMSAWKTPVDEPLWFYDLHPVARELAEDNGDIPLVAVWQLRKGASYFVDTPELELVGASGPVAETDLLLHVDGRVITGEVKTTNELERTNKSRLSAARKRCLWADVVRADEIALATTHAAWGASSVECMLTLLRDYSWRPGHRPRLRLLTQVGSAGSSTELVDW